MKNGLVSEVCLADNQLLLDEVDRLLEGHTVARHNRRGMNLVLDQFVGSLEELSGEDNDRGGAISDFTILDLGELDQNFGGGVGHFELLQDSGAIIGDCYITDVVDKHFVEALGTKGGLHDVGE